MHIPSHVLQPEIAIGAAAVSLPVIAWSLRQSQGRTQQIPQLLAATTMLLGLQAINIPIAGGTSGHLLGGLLLAALFGPWLGTLGISAVFTIQALFLNDGGIDALGANILNGGLTGTLLGYALYRHFSGADSSLLRKSVAAGSASVFSLLFGALLCSVELSLSNHGNFTNTASGMFEGSLPWSLLEGLLNVLILNTVWAFEKKKVSLRRMALCSFCAGLSFLALRPSISSKLPDPVERVLGQTESNALK